MEDDVIYDENGNPVVAEVTALFALPIDEAPIEAQSGLADVYDRELAKEALTASNGDFTEAAVYLLSQGLTDEDLSVFTEKALADEELLNDETYSTFFTPILAAPAPQEIDGTLEINDPAVDPGFVDPFGPPPGPAFTYDPELAKQALDFAGGDLAGAAGFLMDYGLSDADLAFFAEQALADEALLNDEMYGGYFAPPPPPPFDPAFDDGFYDPAFDDGFYDPAMDPGFAGEFGPGFVDPFGPPPGPAFTYDPELAKQALDFAGGDLAGAAGFLMDYGLSDADLAFFAEQALADEALLNDEMYGGYFAPPPPPDGGDGFYDPAFDDGFYDPAMDPGFAGEFGPGFVDPFGPPPGPAFTYDPELAKQALDFAGGDFAGAAGFLMDYGLSDADLAFFAEQALADEALLNDEMYGGYFAPPPPPDGGDGFYGPAFDDGFYDPAMDPGFAGEFGPGFVDPFGPPPGPAFTYDPELAKQALDFAGGDFAGAAGFLMDFGLSDADLAFFAEQALADEALLNDEMYGGYFAPPPPPDGGDGFYGPAFDDGFYDPAMDPGFAGEFGPGFVDPFGPPPGPAFTYDPELAKQALDFAGGDLAGAAGFLMDYGLSDADLAFFAEQALADEALLNDEMYGGYFAPPPPPDGGDGFYGPAFDDGFYDPAMDPGFAGEFGPGFVDPFGPPPGPAFTYDPELAKQALDFAGGDFAGAAGFLMDFGLSDADLAFFAEQALADEALLNDEMYGGYFAPPPPPDGGDGFYGPAFDDGFYDPAMDPGFAGEFGPGFVDPFGPPPGPAFTYDPELAKQALDFAGGDFAGAAGFLMDFGLSDADLAFFAEQALADEALLNDEMYGGYFAPPPPPDGGDGFYGPAFDDGFYDPAFDDGFYDPAFDDGFYGPAFDDGFYDPDDPLWIFPPGSDPADTGDFLADGGDYMPPPDGGDYMSPPDGGDYMPPPDGGDDMPPPDEKDDGGSHDDGGGAPPPPPPGDDGGGYDGMADIGTIGIHDFDIDHSFLV